jgi:hypothetical protein
VDEDDVYTNDCAAVVVKLITDGEVEPAVHVMVTVTPLRNGVSAGAIVIVGPLSFTEREGGHVPTMLNDD